MSVLQKLTEGIVNRNLKKEGAALLEKWERTGLLEGIGGDADRNGMARLLENQAAELLREASTMSGGDVEGFASVAFPIVRRVFGGLLANDLVSVQPMSLPSGLIFFLDFQASDAAEIGGGLENNDSLYGGGRVGQELTGGVQLDYLANTADMGNTARNDLDEGFYNLSSGYSSPTGSTTVTTAQTDVHDPVDNTGTATIDLAAPSEAQKKALRWDPDVLALGDGHEVLMGKVAMSVLEVNGQHINKENLIAVEILNIGLAGGGASDDHPVLVRRLTTLGSADHHPSEAGWEGDETHLYFVLLGTDADISGMGNDEAHGSNVYENSVDFHFPLEDNFRGQAAHATVANQNIGAVAGTTVWNLENTTAIPEIDIKVDSVPVTAVTKKLKAKWTPELGQDLNAYHNLDAEVELTSILSEQIALEIDREILNDLVQGATAGTLYWARSPGLFVHKETGEELGATAAAPDFTGTVSEWYETLLETVNDVSARIHRKTLRGGANFLVTSPEVASILEMTSGFRANVAVDSDKGTAGAVNVGSVSKKWDVFVDPYFPRNLVLVGRKGGSFLESGYVYAPYVPLQVTPTIFGTEDFVPRKGVMTRYAKKMVRPDMYGLVICADLNG